MTNADRIFKTHAQRRQNKINQIKQEIATEQRTHTAAISAAAYAENAGEEKEMNEYLQQADRASLKLDQLRADLEKALEPIPLQEGLAAWEENRKSLMHSLRIRLHEYLESCNDAAEALALLLDQYKRLHDEKIEYAAECHSGDTEEGFQDVLNQFTAYTLDAERMRRSINFFLQFNVMDEEEAAVYKRIL